MSRPVSIRLATWAGWITFALCGCANQADQQRTLQIADTSTAYDSRQGDSRRITRADFNSIGNRATRNQVIAIFGREPDAAESTGGGFGVLACSWYEDDATIIVNFLRDAIRSKSYTPTTSSESLDRSRKLLADERELRMPIRNSVLSTKKPTFTGYQPDVEARVRSIPEGTSKTDVVAILGREPDSVRYPGGSFGDILCYWGEEKAKINITFDMSGSMMKAEYAPRKEK